MYTVIEVADGDPFIRVVLLYSVVIAENPAPLYLHARVYRARGDRVDLRASHARTRRCIIYPGVFAVAATTTTNDQHGPVMIYPRVGERVYFRKLWRSPPTLSGERATLVALLVLSRRVPRSDTLSALFAVARPTISSPSHPRSHLARVICRASRCLRSGMKTYRGKSWNWCK